MNPKGIPMAVILWICAAVFLGGAAARSDALLGGQYGQTAGNTG